MIEKINALKAEIEALEATTPQDVEALRIKYLSKRLREPADERFPQRARRPEARRGYGHQRGSRPWQPRKSMHSRRLPNVARPTCRVST